MSGSKGHSRRAFLGGALAAGAGVALLGDTPLGPRLTWCAAAVHPLARKRVTLQALEHRGRLDLRLVIVGPEFPHPVEIDRTALDVSGPRATWDVLLAYVHPEIVPGRYEYLVEAATRDGVLRTPPIGYTLRRFAFGV